jgi:hypothetical protein
VRIGLVFLAGILTFGSYLLSRMNSPYAGRALSSAKPASSTPAKIDFDTQIKPIFAARCQPCHFSGGVMYERLPFDRPETIKKLGTKLFTRIKDEKQQRLIREFLEQ